jgi:hypothetical protein
VNRVEKRITEQQKQTNDYENSLVNPEGIVLGVDDTETESDENGTGIREKLFHFLTSFPA